MLDMGDVTDGLKQRALWILNMKGMLVVVRSAREDRGIGTRCSGREGRVHGYTKERVACEWS